MCGITVLISRSEDSINPDLLFTMTDALSHRGPDDWGYVFLNSDTRERHFVQNRQELPAERRRFVIGMGHRRLSILDLSPRGRQPMSYDDGRLWIVYNGEIYNYRELRQELSDRGYRFDSDTDTEVILAAYSAWGVDCVKRFNGMWAFVIYDQASESIVLSRDRFGIKPLYYAERNGTLFVSSEIKGIMSGGFVPQINHAVVYDYLAWGYNDHTDETFFKGIHCFPASSIMIIPKRGDWKLWKYWNIDSSPHANDPGLTDEAIAQRLFDLLTDSVRLRLISDVPVGTCLSGGLDSSSLTAIIGILMEKERTGHGQADRGNTILDVLGNRQRVFSACYRDSRADESPFSTLVAKETGAQQHMVLPTAEEFWQDIPSLVRTQDEPFGSTSIYAQYRVMSLVKQHGVKVLLDGQGADEILAGYPGYRGRYLNDLVRSIRIRQLIVEALGPGMGPGERKTAVLVALYLLLPTSIRSYLHRYTNSGASYLSDDFRDTYRHRDEAIAVIGQSSGLNGQLWIDTSIRSLPALLRYEDRNSMAFSIESRVPFLDYRLVQFAFSLPDRLKIKDGFSKWVLRSAVRSVLPDTIVWRKDKKGFVTPQDDWLLTGKKIITESLLAPGAAAEYLNQKDIEAYAQKFYLGEKSDSNLLWRWINLYFWLAAQSNGKTSP